MTSPLSSSPPVCLARPVVQGEALLWSLYSWTRWDKGERGQVNATDLILLSGGADRMQHQGPSASPGWGGSAWISQRLGRPCPREAHYSQP